MRVLSLFDGIACGMLALEQANINVEQYDAYEIDEYELLQTLPLNYVNGINISNTAKFKAIGNGWTIRVITHIFKGLK